MIIKQKIETEFFNLDITITTDGKSHSRADKLGHEFTELLDNSKFYLVARLRNLEKKYKETLEAVGK